MMISSLLIVAVIVLAVGRVEKSTILFHAFHRPVFHFPEFTIPKPELTLQSDLHFFSCFSWPIDYTVPESLQIHTLA